jgi:hypothetical protein
MQPINFDLGKNLLQSPVGIGATGSLAAGTYVSEDMRNDFRRGLKLIVDAPAGTGTITVTIQGKDPLSGKYYTILASAALAVGSTTVLLIYPGATAAANLIANDVLPSTWRVSVVIATNPVTATIGASIIV